MKCTTFLSYLLGMGLGLGLGLRSAHAQSSTAVSVSADPNPTPTSSSTTSSPPNEITDPPGIFESTYPPTITTCFLIQTFSGTLSELGFPASSDLPPFAECWEIIRTGTDIEEHALFTLGPNGLSTNAPTETTGSSPSNSSNSNSSTSHTKAIAASVSIVGSLILVGLLIIWLRHRRRTSSRASMSNSRASAWVRRSGWVKDEKPQFDGIALKEQHPHS
ncbi:hypothetical protein SISSUDRAFT_1053987 [Sistotremastrum suecicum HHB10207 ss-3]|uniref:Mid2 domain-containing protein n=1 Tax=Sistotremastrum suecicum HHB10207 ss-3 TaxID=1314776 RepID=A0A165YUX6_9AGAM|nr:hypothetical protein SISSUDRAFT_1053987 [Sistotremastrum suecicum HHB10207 ss-3]